MRKRKISKKNPENNKSNKNKNNEKIVRKKY